jgi:glycosyltransferase involved in cell wall biosynthesis
MAQTKLSVIIAAHDPAAAIDTCLLALEPQCANRGVEVIVADSSTDGTPARVRSRFPWVTLRHFDEPLTVPVLRGRGIAEASGEVIAILDPYSVVADNWVDCVLAAHARQRQPVIGGTVGLYRSRAASFADWILYLNEYGLFMPPTVKGETWIVPGSNVAYKRAALFDGNTPRYPVFWKTFANWDIEAGGSPLWLEPEMRVDLNKPIPLLDYFRTRYDHGRCFAGMRVKDASPFVRVMRVLSTPGVPFLLVWRWTRGFWPKGQHRARYLLTIPAQLVLFTMWAVGEARGYASGSGGSCGRLFY